MEIEHFKTNDFPLIYLTNKVSDCKFEFKGSFLLEAHMKSLKGELFIRDSILYISSSALGMKNIEYFRFNTQIDHFYNLSYKNVNINVILQNVLRNNGLKNVYIFRLIDGFVIEQHYSDIVYFVTLENGIIGSYISDFENGTKIIVAPRGNILRDQIDYSNYEFRNIE